MGLFGRKKNKKEDKAPTNNSKGSKSNNNNSNNSNNHNNGAASAKPQVVVKIVGDSKHVTTTKMDARGNAIRETVISKLSPEELRMLSGNDDNGIFATSYSNLPTASVTAATHPATGQALSATARTSNTKAATSNNAKKPGKSLEEVMGNAPYTPPTAPYNPHNPSGGRPNPPSDEPSIAAWSLTDDLNRPPAQQLRNQQQQNVNDDPSIAGWSLAEGITSNPSVQPVRSVPQPPPPPPPPQSQQQQKQAQQQAQQPLRPVREDVSSAPSADSAATTNNNGGSDEAIAVTRELVKQFIADIWNRGDVELIPRVCHRKLRFNGHVGMDLVGHDGFARMVTTVRDALTDYHCEIHSMVVESNKAFCRLRFSGKHTGNLLGYPPTGKTVTWMGASEFTCKDGQILKVWELGDVKSLEEQLRS